MCLEDVLDDMSQKQMQMNRGKHGAPDSWQHLADETYRFVLKGRWPKTGLLRRGHLLGDPHAGSTGNDQWELRV